MKVLDLFSGIGGFSLGLERAGMTTVAFCEIEDYPQKVLKKHWPNVPIYNDVTELTYDRLKSDGITNIDVITGGFPCQDISVAGKQAGICEGTRSGLWSEVARLIDEIRPKYAIMENVTALISGGGGRWFGRVLGDLAEIGYDAEWHCIPASQLGAHHHRDRVWIIAYPDITAMRDERGQAGVVDDGKEESMGHSPSVHSNGRQHQSEFSCQGPPLRQSGRASERDVFSYSRGCRQQGQGESIHAQHPKAETIGETIEFSNGSGPEFWRIEPDVGRVANGIPKRMDRLKGLGNAVVPQIPELIGRAIMQEHSRG